MHSALTRLQNVFGFFTTVATAIAVAIAVTSLIATPAPHFQDGSLTLKNVQIVKGRPHYYSQKKEEYAHIKFDLDVDLSKLFTWNTKQVFLYITANYPSSNPSVIPPSTAIIWDAILPHPLSPDHINYYVPPSSSSSSSSSSSKSKSKKSSSTSSKTKDRSKDKKQQSLAPGILRLPGQRPKYQITDPSGKLASRTNVTLELHYNIQPWVGALTWASPTPAGAAPSRSIFSYLSLWRYLPASGIRTAAFGLPALKDRTEAAKAAGPEGLGTAKGGERNRGSPS